MLAARELCENSGMPFEHVFARQYCLSRRPLARTSNWMSPKPLFGWELTHCPKICCVEIQDRRQESIGWLLGSAVDQSGNLIGKSTHKLKATLRDENFWHLVESEVCEFAGRYIAIILTEKGKRAYFDPVMDLPAVFNRNEEMVASSPLMALSRSLRINHRMPRRQILKKGGNYGLQQTCDPDVLRALANHYLDLDSFSLHRHWPGEDLEFEETNRSLDEIALDMVKRLGDVTTAMLENYSCFISVSGGADSRTLVFSAKEKIHLAQMVYSHRTTWISQFDCYVGKLIADALGIGGKFKVFDSVMKIKEGVYDKTDWRRLRWNFCYRTGYQHAPKNAVLILSDILPEAEYILRGNIMDMARANQWPRNSIFDLNHAIGKLALGGRSTEENIKYWGPEYLNWIDTLPEAAKSRIYDFAFVEQLLPNTLGGRLIGYGNACYFNPFNDRRLIQACMQVHPSTRKSGKLNMALHNACGASQIPMARQVLADEIMKSEAEMLFP